MNLLLVTEVGTFMLFFARISALLLSSPFFNSQWLSVRIRVALTLFLSLIAYSLYPISELAKPFSIDYWMMFVTNILFGLAMGFSLHIVFQSVVIAMQTLSMQLGLGFASMVDPANGVSVPVLGQFFVIFFTFIFVTTGAHLALLQVLLNSFDWFSITSLSISDITPGRILEWGSKMFQDAVVLVVGLMSIMLVVNICFGLVARLAPQINIFSLGFPVMVVMGLILIWLSMGYITERFMVMIDEALVLIPEHILNG